MAHASTSPDEGIVRSHTRSNVVVVVVESTAVVVVTIFVVVVTLVDV